MSRSVRKNWVRYWEDTERWRHNFIVGWHLRHRDPLPSFWREPKPWQYQEKGPGHGPWMREIDDYYRRPAPGTIDYEEGWGDNPHPFSLP